MATLEELKAEATIKYPVHSDEDCACYCPGCKESRVRREAYMHAKTLSADGPEVEAAALEIGANEGIDASLDEDDLKHYKLSAIRGFRAAGFYVEEKS